MHTRSARIATRCNGWVLAAADVACGVIARTAQLVLMLVCLTLIPVVGQSGNGDTCTCSSSRNAVRVSGILAETARYLAFWLAVPPATGTRQPVRDAAQPLTWAASICNRLHQLALRLTNSLRMCRGRTSSYVGRPSPRGTPDNLNRNQGTAPCTALDALFSTVPYRTVRTTGCTVVSQTRGDLPSHACTAVCMMWQPNSPQTSPLMAAFPCCII